MGRGIDKLQLKQIEIERDALGNFKVYPSLRILFRDGVVAGSINSNLPIEWNEQVNTLIRDLFAEVERLANSQLLGVETGMGTATQA